MNSSLIHVAPFGALRFVGSRNHGFSPVATTCRPVGTIAGT